MGRGIREWLRVWQCESFKAEDSYCMIRSLFIFNLLIVIAASAQEMVVISGNVRSQNNEPLPGANIFIDSLQTGTSSNSNGDYSLEIPREQQWQNMITLSVSYIGYLSQSVNLKVDRIQLSHDFILKEAIYSGEEIVITGIASKTAKDIAEVAVSRLDAETYTNATSYQSVSQLVTGKAAGVQIAPSSGNVGSGFRFFMRSGGGLVGDEQPVIYIDGVRIDAADLSGFGAGGQGISLLANLNPDDIEDINILKGPAGAASYGTSGSNGVVLITTKRGKTDRKFNLEYKYLYGSNNQSYHYKPENFYSADHANAIFRSGMIRNHNLSLKGGSNLFNYALLYDDRWEEGILRNNHMHRQSFRTNFKALPTDHLEMQINIGYVLNTLTRPQNDNNGYGYLANTLSSPSVYSFTDSISIENIKDTHKTNQFIGSARLNYEPLTGLTIQGAMGADISDWQQDQIFPANFNYLYVNNGLKSIYTRKNQQYTFDLNAQYRYPILPDLQSQSIVGTQLFDRKLSYVILQSENFGTHLITEAGAGSEVTYWGDLTSHSKEAGIFFEQNFSYCDQYFITFGVRRDYASSLSTQAPNIFYPKASFALRLDRYGFLPAMINYLKYRMAYGESGMLPLSRHPIPLLWASASSGYGGGAVISSIGDINIKPERIREFEMGFESEFYYRYGLEFSIYRQFASNSIVPLNLAPSTGKIATGIPYNIGNIKGWGAELLVRATPLRRSQYQLDLQLIYNYQQNEVTDLGGAQPFYDGFGVNIIKEGLAKHQFYGKEVYGAEFDDDRRIIIEANGKHIASRQSQESISLGSPIPPFSGSFSTNFRFLGNFNFYLLSDWAHGHKIYNYTQQWATEQGNNPEYERLANQLDIIDNDLSIRRLQPGSADYVAAANRYALLNPRYTGNYIEKADYLKFREISLSYSFGSLIRTNYIHDIILGLSCRNLFTITKYSGADVELNFDGARSLSRGIDFFTLQNPRVYSFWVKFVF
jgi:TonB-dependent SusC/RagA subfamily outer membrane receptor